MFRSTIVSWLERLTERENPLPANKPKVGDIVKCHADRVFYARIISLDEYLQKAHSPLPLLSQIRVNGGQELCLEVLALESPQYIVKPIANVYSINPIQEIEALDAQPENNPDGTLNAQNMMHKSILQKLING